LTESSARQEIRLAGKSSQGFSSGEYAGKNTNVIPAAVVKLVKLLILSCPRELLLCV